VTLHTIKHCVPPASKGVHLAAVPLSLAPLENYGVLALRFFEKKALDAQQKRAGTAYGSLLRASTKPGKIADVPTGC
jgi:hypothetical protein